MKIVFFLTFIFYKVSFADAPQLWQIGFQDAATPVMEGILTFHNHIMFFVVGITTFVCWLLFLSLSFYTYKKNNEKLLHVYDKSFTHSANLEVAWTIVPALILLLIVIPSFALLYSMEEHVQPTLTLKVIGHQWYWSYEYSDVHQLDNPSLELIKALQKEEELNPYMYAVKQNSEKNLCYNGANAQHYVFDSYMKLEDDLDVGLLRLLEVDKRVILPEKTHIRVLVTAADVLHSWAVPSFGVKIDACPGRLNQISLYAKRPGVYYGQCSEICGVNHAFMPIVVRVVNKNDFELWRIGKLLTNCKNESE